MKWLIFTIFLFFVIWVITENIWLIFVLISISPAIFIIIFLIVITAPPKNKKTTIQENELYKKRRYEAQYSNYYNNNYNHYEKKSDSTTYHKNEIDIDYSKFYKKNSIMTITELNFYKKLKVITDKLQLTIFPEVDLERIIRVYNNIPSYRNRIKSRSVDFTVVNNYTYEIVCCIELDDYSHNRPDRQKRDDFINKLFFYVGLKLYRIPVGNYNMEEIEENLKKITKKAD